MRWVGDASEVELVRQWYFMDENITADALRLIQNGSAQASLTERLQNVPRTLRNFFEENPAYLFSVLLVVVLTVLACLVPHGSAGLTRLTALAPWACCGHAGLSGLARPFFGPRSGLCAAAGGGRGSLPGGVWPAVGIKAAHPHGRALPVRAAAPSRGNAAQTNAVHAHPPTGYRIAHPGRRTWRPMPWNTRTASSCARRTCCATRVCFPTFPQAFRTTP